MDKKYKWGILAPGKIAQRFVEGMATLHEPYIQAIASRSAEKAREFAETFSIPKSYGSYEALVKDQEIDIVYIASPHSFHHEHAKLALSHGKHVLCEKPLTVNAKQAAELIELARKNGLFLMEALWTRFLPVMVQLRNWLNEGIIGEPRMLRAGFNFRTDNFDLDSRLFNPNLAGGALLDVGIYPIMLASMIFDGAPQSIQSTMSKAPTGVDFQSAYLFQYKGGAIATLSAGFEGSGTMAAMVIGTKGEIRIPVFWKGSEAHIFYKNGQEESHTFPFESSGLQYQALHFMDCLDKGLLESPIMSLNESLELQKTMDRIRGEWGLTYPFED